MTTCPDSPHGPLTPLYRALYKVKPDPLAYKPDGSDAWWSWCRNCNTNRTYTECPTASELDSQPHADGCTTPAGMRSMRDVLRVVLAGLDGAQAFDQAVKESGADGLTAVPAKVIQQARAMYIGLSARFEATRIRRERAKQN